MKKDKVSKILSGIVVVVLGVLIAIFGAETVLDTYLGIVACISGGCLLLSGVFLMGKKDDVPAETLVSGSVLLAIGISLFTSWLSVAVIIQFLVIVILGAGAGFILFGVYKIAKKDNALGIFNLVVGIAAIIIAALYIGVPKFHSVFWIIVGILIAVYGAIETCMVVAKKK